MNTNKTTTETIIAAKIAALKEKYGAAGEYVLTQQPNVYDVDSERYGYQACAVRPADAPQVNASGYHYLPGYRLTWDVTPEHLAYVSECQTNGDTPDEGDACDWDHPASVEENGPSYVDDWGI